MVIIHFSHSRGECAMLEQSLICHFQQYEQRRCANRKNDLDIHFMQNNNDSNSEDERSEGPYAVYVVVGKQF